MVNSGERENLFKHCSFQQLKKSLDPKSGVDVFN